MTQFPLSTSNEQTIHAALELSKNSWLLALQVPGRDNPSLHPIKGGDAEGLMAKLDAARDRVARLTGRTPQVRLCYEAGYDGSDQWTISPVQRSRLAQNGHSGQAPKRSKKATDSSTASAFPWPRRLHARQLFCYD